MGTPEERAAYLRVLDAITTKRRGWLAASGVFTALLLTGCGAEPQIAARLQDGVLETAFCTDQEVNSVRIYVDQDGEWNEVWSSPQGMPIRSAVPITVETEDDVEPGQSIQVHFAHDDETGRTLQDAWAEFLVSEIAGDQWVSASGSRSDSPCP